MTVATEIELPTLKDATFFALNDFPCALESDSVINGILQKFKTKQAFDLSPIEIDFATRHRMHALIQFSNGAITFSKYRKLAIEELRCRIAVEEQKQAVEVNSLTPPAVVQYDWATSPFDPLVTIKDAKHYYLDDFPTALIPKTLIYGILQKLKTKLPIQLSAPELDLLNHYRVKSVIQLLKSQINFAEFKRIARTEQQFRLTHFYRANKPSTQPTSTYTPTNEVSASVQEYQQCKTALHEQWEAERQRKLEEQRIEALKEKQRIENEARLLEEYKAEQERLKKQAEKEKKLETERIERRKLQNKYFDFDYVEVPVLRRMTAIAQKLEKKIRISKDDAVWVFSSRDLDPTNHFLTRYHNLEAKHHIAQFKRRKDKWELINASSQYRKANMSAQAKQLLLNSTISKSTNDKLLSAYHTTFGGVERDLKNSDSALKHGQTAHQLTPKNYRPCTLLGALHMEQGEYGTGAEWYEKAIERGAPERGVDNELSIIFKRLNKEEQEKMLKALKNKSYAQYEHLLKFRKR